MGKAMKAKSETVWIGRVEAGPAKGLLILWSCRRAKEECDGACALWKTSKVTAIPVRLTPIKPRGKRRGKR